MAERGDQTEAEEGLVSKEEAIGKFRIAVKVAKNLRETGRDVSEIVGSLAKARDSYLAQDYDGAAKHSDMALLLAEETSSPQSIVATVNLGSCPTCSAPLEQKGQKFCRRCGQLLATDPLRTKSRRAADTVLSWPATAEQDKLRLSQHFGHREWPEERVEKQLRFHVWYASQARSTDFWKFKLYDDSGVLETVGNGLVFKGARLTINMPKIFDLDLQPVKGGLGSKQVEIEYRSTQGVRERAHFIGKATLREESIAQTSRVFDALSTWFESKQNGSECGACGSTIPRGNDYCGRCGASSREKGKIRVESLSTERARSAVFATSRARQGLPNSRNEHPLESQFPREDSFPTEDGPSEAMLPPNQTRQGGEAAPNAPRKSAAGGLAAVIMAILIIVAVAFVLSLGSGPGGFTGFRISGSGCWSGAFGNVGSQSSIDGCGSRDIPMRCDGVLSGVVQKNDDGSWTLALRVFSNGKALESASTSAEYGVASAADSC